MALFQKRIDIWSLSAAQRATLQPGQHISAGGAKGVYLGQTRSGVDVALWEAGMRTAAARARKIQDLRSYVRR